MDQRAWDSQPWWAQAIYIEGLTAEAPWVKMPMLEAAIDPFAPDVPVWLDKGEIPVEVDDDGVKLPDSLSDLAEIGLGVSVR